MRSQRFKVDIKISKLSQTRGPIPHGTVGLVNRDVEGYFKWEVMI